MIGCGILPIQRKRLAMSILFTRRIKSVARISLDLELDRQFRRLKPGITLDVGSKKSPYKSKIPHTKYMRLDVDEKTNPDICCDIHHINWESSYFDTVIATEVLEHCYSPEKAVGEIYRILKPEGVCILSTRFIYPYHPTPGDYYRFTQDSLGYLFRDFSKVEICHHGNKIQSLWLLINTSPVNTFLNLLNPLIARIRFKNTKFPCGFVVYSVK